MKKIVIAGGAGFLGQALTNYFSAQGDEVKVLSRKPSEAHHIQWDGRSLGAWEESLENIDVLINLCGKSVDCRYTEKNKKEIIDSRVLTTSLLQRAINRREAPPKLWLNASSATIYIHSETLLHTEQDGIIGDDFSMNVCKRWEKTFFREVHPEVRKVALRTSIVLGKEGGAYPKLQLITRLGAGGVQGNGTQKVSWIHVEDFCRAIGVLIENEELAGAVNITAPNPVSNAHLMESLRRQLGVPFGVNQPKWLLEIGARLMGTETELLLKSRNVSPQRLIEAQFDFKYPTIQECLGGL